jgi:ribosomal-protein-alanine N-acetyltransferase
MSALLKDPLLGIRPMREEDLATVIAIELQVYEFPWTLGIFRDCLRVGYCCWVITLSERVIGYGVTSVAVEECHLLNVCIHPDWQGQGLGQKLVRRLLNLARQHGAETAFLEVRQSNDSACALYRRLGFVDVGRRRDYYPTQGGREDALVLSLML